MWCQKDNKHKPDAMDVYKFLWRGRDIELTYIWQRSVFLAVFLIGVVSGYAIYFKDIFLNQFKTDLVYKYDYIIAIAIFGLVGRFADLSRR